MPRKDKLKEKTNKSPRYAVYQRFLKATYLLFIDGNGKSNFCNYSTVYYKYKLCTVIRYLTSTSSVGSYQSHTLSSK